MQERHNGTTIWNLNWDRLLTQGGRGKTRVCVGFGKGNQELGFAEIWDELI